MRAWIPNSSRHLSVGWNPCPCSNIGIVVQMYNLGMDPKLSVRQHLVDVWDDVRSVRQHLVHVWDDVRSVR